MVKYTVKGPQGDLVKFTRELNVYGVGEELLYPIKLNDCSRGSSETNLATYLVKHKEFLKTSVKVKKSQNKDGFFTFKSFRYKRSLVLTTRVLTLVTLTVTIWVLCHYL